MPDVHVGGTRERGGHESELYGRLFRVSYSYWLAKYRSCWHMVSKCSFNVDKAQYSRFVILRKDGDLTVFLTSGERHLCHTMLTYLTRLYASRYCHLGRSTTE